MSRRTRFYHGPRRAFTVLAAVLLALAGPPGCSDRSSDVDRESGRSGETPVLRNAEFVDSDGNGVDGGDVLLLRFSKAVLVQGSSVDGFQTRSSAETLGDGAELRQSVPGSDRVEIVLGDEPRLTPEGTGTAGVTELNLAASGAGIVQVTTADDRAVRAARAARNVLLADVTVSAPVLLEARFVDSDSDGVIGPGDRVVASFNKPVSVPGGAAVADNFILPVSGDSFGASPTLEPASSASTNRTVAIVLGAGASLSPRGAFAPGAVSSGSPSGLEVAVAPTITDALASSPNTLSPGVEVDIGGATASFFGNGRGADAVLGAPDPFTPGLGAQGLKDPAGVDSFTGTLTIAGQSQDVSLLFVADRGNNRVLIFERFTGGSFPAASWVLGRPDFTTPASADPADPATSSPSASGMSSPAGVAYDAPANRLFVSDTGNNRLLVWNDLFTLDASSGALSLSNGRPASFAWGQASLTAGSANRGAASPGALSLSSPGGLEARAGRLLVADRGNHRVLLFGSSPAAASTLPAAVLGQADFTSGASNRGGAVAANTLSSPEDVFSSEDLSINSSDGALLVADTGNHRVLVFEVFSPSTGADASLALGQVDLLSADTATAATRLKLPSGVTADAASSLVFAADRGNQRVMVYSVAGAVASGLAGVAIGQATATDGSPNRGGAPSADTLDAPGAVEIASSTLLVADGGNNRLLLFGGASLPTAHRAATQVIGQPSFSAVTPGGRRLQQPYDAALVKGRLIVSDTANHRVLIYNSAPLSGDPDPDVVVGQANLFETSPNRGGNASLATLRSPTSVASDGTRLVVSDTGNHRVLIWSAIPGSNGLAADLVLGQPDASSSLPNAGGAASANTFHSPEGLAVAGDTLIVADRENNRVLVFPGLSGLGSFSSARNVLGQRDPGDVEENRGGDVTANTLSRPRDVLVGAGNLYVADTGNHRVLVWDGVPTRNGVKAQGLYGQADFSSAVPAGATPETLVEPSGLAMDPGGNFLIVSDTAHHRVVFFDDVEGRKPDGRSAGGVLGQSSLFGGAASEPSLGTLESPRGLFFNGYELYAADSGGSRVVVFR